MGKSLGLIGRHKYHIDPDVIEKVRTYSRDLMTKTQISECLGIHINTLIDKLKESKELNDAYNQGRAEGLELEAKEIREVKRAIFMNAKPHEVLDKEGNPFEVPGDVKAQTFILERRAGWVNQTKVDLGSDPDRPILIAPLFAINYKKDLDSFTKVLDEAND